MRVIRIFATFAALVATIATPRSRVASAGAALSRYAVIIVLDGARPDYFRFAKMPNFQWLVRHGVWYRNAFAGQVSAITPPSHATIGTGLFPKHHGVQGFVWTDPRTGRMTRPADTIAVLGGALEQVLEQHHVHSVASAMKSFDPRGKVVTVSGHKCYAADAMGTAAADYILCSLIYHGRWVAQAVANHRPPPGAINNSHWDVPIPSPHSGFAPAVEQWKLGSENDWTMRYSLWAFHRVHYPRVLMINLPETDVMGHFATNIRSTAGSLMRGFDRNLGLLLSAYRRAGIIDRTSFIVTSDHGMSQIRSRLSFSVLDQAISDAGASKVYVEADTAAMIGITQPSRAKRVALNVASLGGTSIDATFFKKRQGNGWAYEAAAVSRRVSRPLLRAYQTVCDTTAAAEGPDVIAVYAPRVTTGDREQRGYHWVAGHLGPQWDDQHIPFLISGSGVRQGKTSSYAARLVDIAPTVEHLLGLPAHKSDGHILWDGLIQSSSAERHAQATIGRPLAGLIASLRARSR